VSVLRPLSLVALYASLLWPAVAFGAHRGWPLALSELLALAGVLLWVVRMLADRRLQWRRTALDLPLALLLILVLVQLAVGNGPMAAWALGPPPAASGLAAPFPSRFVLGTVAPPHTLQALWLFLTYASVYVLVVNLVRTRRELARLIRVLLVLGGMLAFLALLEYLTGEGWLIRWREGAVRGRLRGPFVNPDHFGSWLAMLVCLGIGYVLGRSGASRGTARLPGRHERREELVRRYLPSVGVGLMGLGLIFTLSRGAILSLLVALAALLALQGALGHMRWSLVLVSTLLIVTLGYGAWIGFEPLLERVWHADMSSRWVQALSTLPMLQAFPVLGVGLGAYREIYFRYQPVALESGRMYYPYAHNDLLQFAVETGIPGALLGLFAVWRVLADLVGAHCLGRGRCPVGGGEEDGARRHEPFSLGVATGALAAVLALLVHSAFDFSARIPANGVLAAACLGIATVALHTRFSGNGDRLLTAVRSRSLRGRLAPALIGGATVTLGVVLAMLIVRPARVEATLEGPRGAALLTRIEDAFSIDPTDVRVLKARAQLRLAAARHVWSSGQAPGGRTLATWDERRREALALLSGAIDDLRGAIRRTPSDPYLHEILTWAHATQAALAPASAPEQQRLAFAAMHRSIALQPENPFFYRSLAILAAGPPAPVVPLVLESTRAALTRYPALLADMVDVLLPLGLDGAQWLAIVPESPIDQLELGALLESRGLGARGREVYGRAAELAQPSEEPLARWMLARLLLRQEEYRPALIEIRLGRARDRDNAELELAEAQALAGLEDPGALPAYRGALLTAEDAARRSASEWPFRVSGDRGRKLLTQALGGLEPPRPSKYRRALAGYLADRRLWEAAAAEWERALAETPGDARAQFGLGQALSGLGRRADALEAYRKAVALDGSAVAYRLHYAQGLWDTEQFYQAINQWRAVVAHEPGNIEAHLALARAYLRVGDRLEAFREYQRVLLLSPDQPEARRGLARLGEGR